MLPIKFIAPFLGRKHLTLYQKLSSKASKYRMHSKSHPFTIAIEGNIGSGKTTFLNHFKNQDVCILDEPVHMWRNCCGENLLGLMYQDAKKWAFTFQSYVQLTMMTQHLKQTNHPVKLMERSIYSARYIFVENAVRNEILPLPSAVVIDEWFKWIISNRDMNVDLIVYLQTSPEVAFERMKNRNRSEENTVPLEYLRQLHELHEDWLVRKTKFNCTAPVIVVNGDKDISVSENQYQSYKSMILDKIPQKNIAFNF